MATYRDLLEKLVAQTDDPEHEFIKWLKNESVVRKNSQGRLMLYFDNDIWKHAGEDIP